MGQLKASGQSLTPPFTWSDGLRGHLHDLLKAFEAWSLKEHGFVPPPRPPLPPFAPSQLFSPLIQYYSSRSKCDDSVGKPVSDGIFWWPNRLFPREVLSSELGGGGEGKSGFASGSSRGWQQCSARFSRKGGDRLAYPNFASSARVFIIFVPGRGCLNVFPSFRVLYRDLFAKYRVNEWSSAEREQSPRTSLYLRYISILPLVVKPFFARAGVGFSLSRSYRGPRTRQALSETKALYDQVSPSCT